MKKLMARPETRRKAIEALKCDIHDWDLSNGRISGRPSELRTIFCRNSVFGNSADWRSNANQRMATLLAGE